MAAPPGWEPVTDKPPGWAPVPSPESSVAPAPVSPDLIGQIKSQLIPERAPGENTLFGETDLPGRVVRGVGKFVVPGSWPGAVSLLTSLIPGVGIPMALARTGAAAGTGAAIEGVRGGDPVHGALEAGGGTLAGETVGGVARAGARYVLSKLDQLPANLANAIGHVVPAFKGETPRATLGKAMGTEGQVALSRQYGDALDNAIVQAGDPFVTGPGFAGPASVVMKQLKAEKHRLITEARDPARVENVYQRLENVHEAEDALAKELTKRLPAEMQGVFAENNAAYRAGKEIQRLFTGSPRTKMTPGQVEKIVGPGERLMVDQPTLATNLMLRSGRLKEALGPEEYALLEAAIQRGGALGSRDIPGVSPQARIHLGFLPTLYGLPHAPRLVGKPEAQSAIVADLMRKLGVRGAGSLIEDNQ